MKTGILFIYISRKKYIFKILLGTRIDSYHAYNLHLNHGNLQKSIN